MDFESMTVLPEPSGVYLSPLGFNEYSRTPTYGRRRVYLPLIKKWAEQVRVAGFGGLYWINESVENSK